MGKSLKGAGAWCAGGVAIILVSFCVAALLRHPVPIGAMSWLEFIAKIVQFTVWPLTTCFVVTVFRSSIVDKLRGLTKIASPWGVGEFAVLDAAKEEVSGLLDPTSSQSDPGELLRKYSQHASTVAQDLEVLPRDRVAAIYERIGEYTGPGGYIAWMWTGLQRAAFDLAKRKNIDGIDPSNPNFVEVLVRLERDGVITDSEVHVAMSLRRLKRKAVMRRGTDIPKDEVDTFKNIIEALIARWENL